MAMLRDLMAPEISFCPFGLRLRGRHCLLTGIHGYCTRRPREAGVVLLGLHYHPDESMPDQKPLKTPHIAAQMAAEIQTENPKLAVEQHMKYWKRCLRTVLPTGYTSNDSSRMALGFFILSALDLLGASAEVLNVKERAEIRDWILKCQHPNGGFCGSPNHKYPDSFYVDVGRGKTSMDPANLPATFFATLALSFVGPLDYIKRRECLRWLRTLQRKDGSFGEIVTDDGNISGGHDMRYCYVATAIRWMLGGDASHKELDSEADINVEGLVNHLRSGQTYDGGISESTTHESHAGYTYCAIAALALLDRLPANSTAPTTGVPAEPRTQPHGVAHILGIIQWLVSRQVEFDAEEEGDDGDYPYVTGQSGGNSHAAAFNHQNNNTDNTVPDISGLSLGDPEYVGFNGRCNKPVDTCYAFWVTASLDMLGHNKAGLLDAEGPRRFLLRHTQHRIGGFGKTPGDPPDIYHSYLGLAALAIKHEPGLKQLDSALCISKKQRERIEKMRKDALVPRRTYWKHGYAFSVRQDHLDFEEKLASSEGPPEALLDALKGS